jgi:hypothetical protein
LAKVVAAVSDSSRRSRRWNRSGCVFWYGKDGETLPQTVRFARLEGGF